MSISYSTTVATVGGRNGTATSDDGRLALRLAIPRELGGKGEGTNPSSCLRRVMPAASAAP